MDIYIDESGLFIPPEVGKQAISLIGALIVPNVCKRDFFKMFKALKRTYGYDGKEIKGKFLDDEKIKNTLYLLKNFPVIYEFVVTDLAYQEKAELEKHKELQVKILRESITDKFTEDATNYMNGLADRIENLSLQLYLQMQALIELMDKVIRRATLYYCQRFPIELSQFNFFIDAKDKEITSYEKIWVDVYQHFIMTKGFKKPLEILPLGDYSYFKQYEIKKELWPSYLWEHYGIESADSYDINAIYQNVKIVQSHEVKGLQAVDILVNATKRSLEGKLNTNTVRFLRKVLLQQKKNTLPVISYSDNPQMHKTTEYWGRFLAADNEPMMVKK